MTANTLNGASEGGFWVWALDGSCGGLEKKIGLLARLE